LNAHRAGRVEVPALAAGRHHDDGGSGDASRDEEAEPELEAELEVVEPELELLDAELPAAPDDDPELEL
jgi:hypothetical protein